MTSSKKPLKIDGRGKSASSKANLVKGREKLAKLRVDGVLTNPNGYSLTADIKHKLSEEADFISTTATPHTKLWRDQIARAILVKAANGDVPMVKEVWDRVDGKVSGDKEGATFNDIKVLIVREAPQSNSEGFNDATKGNV